jgi:hypothetical protein
MTPALTRLGTLGSGVASLSDLFYGGPAGMWLAAKLFTRVGEIWRLVRLRLHSAGNRSCVFCGSDCELAVSGSTMQQRTRQAWIVDSSL